MDNPLRWVAARITDGIERLRSDDEASVVVTDVDDDPEAEPVAACNSSASPVVTSCSRGTWSPSWATTSPAGSFPLPIPGLSWLLRRIVGGITSLYERRRFTPEEPEALETGLGHALTDIERRGLDIELSGALRVLMFFSFGLSAAIESEAADRGVKVVGATA